MIRFLDFDWIPFLEPSRFFYEVAIHGVAPWRLRARRNWALARDGVVSEVKLKRMARKNRQRGPQSPAEEWIIDALQVNPDSKAPLSAYCTAQG